MFADASIRLGRSQGVTPALRFLTGRGRAGSKTCFRTLLGERACAPTPAAPRGSAGCTSGARWRRSKEGRVASASVSFLPSVAHVIAGLDSSVIRFKTARVFPGTMGTAATAPSGTLGQRWRQFGAGSRAQLGGGARCLQPTCSESCPVTQPIHRLRGAHALRNGSQYSPALGATPSCASPGDGQ